MRTSNSRAPPPLDEFRHPGRECGMDGDIRLPSPVNCRPVAPPRHPGLVLPFTGGLTAAAQYAPHKGERRRTAYTYNWDGLPGHSGVRGQTPGYLDRQQVRQEGGIFTFVAIRDLPLALGGMIDTSIGFQPLCQQPILNVSSGPTSVTRRLEASASA